MTIKKRSTILATTLLSVTLLSTTGCIQKQPERVIGEPYSNPIVQKQHIGAKTVPYTPQPVQYTQAPPVQQYIPPQPSIQYTQPAVQYSQQTPIPIYKEVEEEGCADDIPSNCDIGSIDKSQISTQYAQQSSNGGVMHTLKSIKGKTIQIGERKNGFTFPTYPGKVVILEMFGKNCPHCIKEIPTLKKIKSRYGNRVEVVGIHSQGVLSANAGKNFINKYRVNYPITDGSRARELQYFIQNTYGWTGILPFTMIIKDGQTEGSFSGEVSYKELLEVMDSLF